MPIPDPRSHGRAEFARVDMLPEFTQDAADVQPSREGWGEGRTPEVVVLPEVLLDASNSADFTLLVASAPEQLPPAAVDELAGPIASTLAAIPQGNRPAALLAIVNAIRREVAAFDGATARLLDGLPKPG